MNATNTEMLIPILKQKIDDQHCPECGAVMMETDRLKESGTLFVWYKCTKSYCDGTWLKAIRE